MFYGETNTLTMVASSADAEKQISDKDAGMRSRFADFPSEQPAKAVREKWCREARRAMSAEQTAVMRGQVPARLAAETAEMDMTTLPALDAAATASEKNGRFNPQIHVEGF